MTQEETIALIRTALAAGCGLIIQFFFRQFLEWKKEKGEEVSPVTKRWLAIGLSAAVPSVLYLALVFFVPEAYSLFQHASYVGVAFMASQGLHALSLPTGADVRVRETFGEGEGEGEGEGKPPRT